MEFGRPMEYLDLVCVTGAVKRRAGQKRHHDRPESCSEAVAPQTKAHRLSSAPPSTWLRAPSEGRTQFHISYAIYKHLLPEINEERGPSISGLDSLVFFPLEL